MKNIQVNKVDLLQKIKINREQHRTSFIEADKGYREEVIQALSSRLEDIKSGKEINLFFDLPKPINYTDEYNRVIAMLEMEISSVIELSQAEFMQYVQDDWAWKKEFVGTTSLYNNKF